MGVVLEALKSHLAKVPSVPEQQKEAETSLPQILALTHLHLWKAGDPIPPHGTRFLIGVATWSDYDWALLDRLAMSGPQSLCHVDIFDVDACQVADHKTPADFERYVPDIGPVYHTPIVGRWQDGLLVERASGFKGRTLLEDWFGISLNAMLNNK